MSQPLNFLEPTGSRMADTAFRLRYVASHIDRVPECLSGRRGLCNLFGRPLSQNRMTGVTVMSNHFAVPAFMKAVVATETAVGIQMPQVIGVGLPVNPHIGKKVFMINF